MIRSWILYTACLFVWVLFLWGTHAQAQVVFLSPFDSPDDDTGGYDSFEFIHEMLGGSIDGDMELQWTIVNNSDSSGHDSSNGAIHINLTSGEKHIYEPALTDAGVCEMDTGLRCYDDTDCSGGGNDCRIADYSPFPLNVPHATIRANLHIGSDGPSGNRRILEFRDIGTCNGGTADGNPCVDQSDCPGGVCETELGCNVEMTSADKYELFYNTEQLATPDFIVRQYACEAPYEYLPCTVNADCPGDCSSGSGNIKYFSPIELEEEVSEPVVTCRLRVAGRIIGESIAFTPTSRTATKIATYRFGGTNTDTETIEYWFDDTGLYIGDRAGHGYIATLYPKSDGAISEWTNTSTSQPCNGDFCRGGSNDGQACSDDSDCEPNGVCDKKSYWQCVNDYNRYCVSGSDIYEACWEDSDCSGSTCDISPTYILVTNSGLKKQLPDKRQNFNVLSSDIGLSGDLIVDGVDAIAIGETNTGAGIREIIFGFEVTNESGTDNVDTETISLNSDLVDRLLARIAGVNPTLGRNTYTQTDLDGMGINISTSKDNAKLIRLGATQIYAAVTRPDVPLPRVTLWGNKGTDQEVCSNDISTSCTADSDCPGGSCVLQSVVFIVGDSTSGITEGLACPADAQNPGEKCSQATYCSQDDDERDKGNCTEDEHCVTCSGRTTEANALIGYFCDLTGASSSWTQCSSTCDGGTNDLQMCLVASDCPGGSCVTNTCVTATDDCPAGEAKCCSKNPVVPCDVDADCTGDMNPENNLGICQTDETCKESCPGSACPEAQAWPNFLLGNTQIDVLVNCAMGAQKSWTVDAITTQLDDILDGDELLCKAIKGSGQCTCTVNADCDPNGTCTSGLCTASDGFKDKCTATYPHCTYYGVPVDEICQFPKPKTIYSLLGTNDIASFPPNRNCTGVTATGSIGSGKPCSPAAITECMDDTDCTGDALCIGTRTSLSYRNTLCNMGGADFTGGPTSSCTVWHKRCATNGDCAGYGSATCTGHDSSLLYGSGRCICTSDSDCPLNAQADGYACESGICHKKCPGGGGNCGGAGRTCNTTPDPDVCKGACTYPSSAQACTDDSDCILTYTDPHALGTVILHGNCNVDECECTGWNHCPLDTDCYSQYQEQWLAPRESHNKALDIFLSWQQKIADLSESDGRPIIVFMTVFDFTSDLCTIQRPDKQYNLKNNHILLNAHRCSGGTDDGGDCEADSDCAGVGTCERLFTHVIDTANIIDAYPYDVVLEDDVHPGQFAGSLIGDRGASYRNAFNTCAVNEDTPNQVPQRYCRNLDLTWGLCVSGTQAGNPCEDDTDCPGSTCSETTCDLATESTDCTTSQRCELKSCTVAGDCPDSGDVCNVLN